MLIGYSRQQCVACTVVIAAIQQQLGKRSGIWEFCANAERRGIQYRLCSAQITVENMYIHKIVRGCRRRKIDRKQLPEYLFSLPRAA
ncbi:MAG: hypothetical protein B7Z72_09595 [Gemmatimonadetes bacterium 21-71-4]|nr:MAG: hypothetical protein B7Z72_09595 [Gemmatimonadetes bacterium 21-71-4]